MKKVLAVALIMLLVMVVLLGAIFVIRNRNFTDEPNCVARLLVWLVVSFPFVILAVAYGVMLNSLFV